MRRFSRTTISSFVFFQLMQAMVTMTSAAPAERTVGSWREPTPPPSREQDVALVNALLQPQNCNKIERLWDDDPHRSAGFEFNKSYCFVQANSDGVTIF